MTRSEGRRTETRNVVRVSPDGPHAEPMIRSPLGHFSGDLSHCIRFRAVMTDTFSDADWEELADLVTEAPPERIRLAMRHIDASGASATALLSGADRLLRLATISPGNAFDMALLRELRRLSVH